MYTFLTVSTSRNNPRFIELPGNCVFYTNSDFSSSFFLHALLDISSYLQLWWHAVRNYCAFRSSFGQQLVFSYLVMSILSRWSAEFFVCEEYDLASSINSTFHLYEQWKNLVSRVVGCFTSSWGRPGKRLWALWQLTAPVFKSPASIINRRLIQVNKPFNRQVWVSI